MRDLNGRNETRVPSAAAAAAPSRSVKPKKKKKKGKLPAAVPARPLGSPANKPPKRSRLPAAAVKEMRSVSRRKQSSVPASKY